MSGGKKCQCDQKRLRLGQRVWEVTAYKVNYSAFNGYQATPSRYSEVTCPICGARWRTTGRYIEKLAKNPMRPVRRP